LLNEYSKSGAGQIRNLHEKMDHLLLHQWQKLMEIQQIQLDLLEENARNDSK